MLAVLAALFFGFPWLLHGIGSTHIPVWFNWNGMALIGLALVALHLIWPLYPWRRP